MKKIVILIFALLTLTLLFIYGVSSEPSVKYSLDRLGYRPYPAMGHMTIKDGNVEEWLKENPQVYEKEKTTSIQLWGWAGPDAPIANFTYIIDKGDPVNGDFTQAAEPELIKANGNYTRRFLIELPVANLSAANHEIKVMVNTTNGNSYKLFDFSFKVEERKSMLNAYVDHIYTDEDLNESLLGVIGREYVISQKNPKDYILYNTDVENLYVLGWAGDNYPIKNFAYKINDGPYHTEVQFMEKDLDKGDEILLPQNGGPNAKKYRVTIPLKGLTTGIHKISVWASLEGDRTYRVMDFFFVLLDDNIRITFKGCQIRKSLVPQSNNINDLRQGLRFVFDMPKLASYKNSNGKLEISRDGALITDMAIEGKDGNLIDVSLNGKAYRAAYIYQIDKANRKTKMYVKPYFELLVNGEKVYIYGEIQGKSVTDIYLQAANKEEFDPLVSAWWPN